MALDGRVARFLETHEWSKGAYARDRHRVACDIDDKNACTWCLIGAIYKCYDDIADTRLAMLAIIRTLKLEHTTIPSWNDDKERIKQDVIDVCKKAGV